MLPKGGNLWVKNAAKESALIAEMRKGVKLVVKAASLRGHQSIDTYALRAVSQAMDRLQRMSREVTCRFGMLAKSLGFPPSRQRAASFGSLVRRCFALKTT